MAVAVTDRFHAKQGRSTGRWILQARRRAAGARRLSVYLKRHYELPWWRGLLASLWPGRGWSPAMQEWQHLEWARRQGVPVPAVVAAAEYIGPWGGLQSFLAVEELAGMLPLHEAIPLAAVRSGSRQRSASGNATLVAEMARLSPHAARPPLLPQGPLPLSLLHRPRRYADRAAGRLARPGLPDRSAPPGTPSAAVANMADKRPRATPVFLGNRRRGRARSAGVSGARIAARERTVGLAVGCATSSCSNGAAIADTMPAINKGEWRHGDRINSSCQKWS